jgi:anthranilate/para-aminobenzoate synthase component I
MSFTGHMYSDWLASQKNRSTRRSIFSSQARIKTVDFNKLIWISDDQAHSMESDKSRKKSNQHRFFSLIKGTNHVGKKNRAKNQSDEIEYVLVDSIENLDPNIIQKKSDDNIDIHIASAIFKSNVIVNDNDTHEFCLHRYKNRFYQNFQI